MVGRLQQNNYPASQPSTTKTNLVPLSYTSLFLLFFLNFQNTYFLTSIKLPTMVSPHRKLLPIDPPLSNPPSTTVETCLLFCDPPLPEQQINNQTILFGFCPYACLAICPSLCHYALPEPQQQPMSPPLLPPLQPNKPHNISPLFISLFTILASAFLLITFYILYTKLYRHLYFSPNQTRPSLNQGSDPTPSEDNRNSVIFHPIWYIPTVGHHPSVINSIAVHKYGPTGSPHVEGSDCAVCLTEFLEGDLLRVLPSCNHAFHVPCIDTWLRSHTNCPLCRAPVVAPSDSSAEPRSTPRVGSSSDQNPVHSDEVRISMTRSVSMEMNKEEEEVSESSSSLERRATSLASRSLSCGAKTFSSRYYNHHNNDRPGPNNS